MLESDKDLQSYLARIRKTISESKNLVSQVELRMAETDRMLAQHGLTREQVMAMRFSDEQIAAANAELKRRGLTPMEVWANDDDAAPQYHEAEVEVEGISSAATADEELENRSRKFGMMMKPFQI